MIEGYYWAGTWLDAAFLIPAGARAWPTIIENWAHANLVDRGSAELLDICPDEATSARILESRSVPDISWVNQPVGLVTASKEQFVSSLVVPLHGAAGLHEMRIDAMINDDDTLTIYVNIPLEVAYTGQTAEGRTRNLHFFANLACRMFPLESCLLGAIGEETYIDGLAEARQRPGDLADWAFYGKWMTAELMRQLGHELAQVRGQAREWRVIGDRALFVRWTEFDSVTWAPPIWIEAVRAALRTFIEGAPLSLSSKLPKIIAPWRTASGLFYEKSGGEDVEPDE